MSKQLELFADDVDLGLDRLKLQIAKLVCCGPRGCIGLVKHTPDDVNRCWCEMPDCQKGGFIHSTTEAIIELFVKGK